MCFLILLQADHELGWKYLRHLPDMEEFQQLHSFHDRSEKVSVCYTMVMPLIRGPEAMLSKLDMQALYKATLLLRSDIVVKVKAYKGNIILQLKKKQKFLFYPGFRVSVSEIVHVGDWVRIGVPSVPPSDPRYSIGVTYGKVLRICSIVFQDKWDLLEQVTDVSFLFFSFIFLLFNFFSLFPPLFIQ